MGSAEEASEGAEPDFGSLSEGELAGLSNDDLVDYIGRAAESGDRGSARMASAILAYGMEPTIVAWVRRGMGSQGEADVEDVVMDVLESVVHSSFDGKLIGEFGSFLKTITQRRVVDWFRKRERRERDEPLANEHDGDEEVWGEEIGVADESDAIAMRDAVDRVLATRQEMHQKVIRLYGPGYIGCQDLSADETVARINADASEDTVTSANVHQIWKRFKTDLAKELELDG